MFGWCWYLTVAMGIVFSWARLEVSVSFISSSPKVSPAHSPCSLMVYWQKPSQLTPLIIPSQRNVVFQPQASIYLYFVGRVYVNLWYGIKGAPLHPSPIAPQVHFQGSVPEGCSMQLRPREGRASVNASWSKNSGGATHPEGWHGSYSYEDQGAGAMEIHGVLQKFDLRTVDFPHLSWFTGR